MMNAKKLKERLGKVAVLMGGPSEEHEVSLLSGNSVLNILLQADIDAHLFYLESNIISKLEENHISRVFIAVHGKLGEDGSIQGALEIADIPYTGSGVLASALGMNKYFSKLIWQANQLATPDFQLLRDETDILNFNFEKNIRYIIKPVSSGSSLGVSIIDHPNQLKEAYHLASKQDHQVLAETYIEGKEWTVAILDELVFPPFQIKTTEDFFDYETKYKTPVEAHAAHANLSESEENQIKSCAQKAYHSLDCKGLARVDLIQDESKKIWALEVNTIPGFRKDGAIATASKRMNLSLSKVFLKALEKTL